MSEIEAQYIVATLPQPPAETGFVVDCLDKAVWCLRKIRLIRQSMAERTAFVDRERARLQTFLDEATAKSVQELNYFEGLLRGYYEREAEAGKLGKSKTLQLPGGSLQKRRRPLKWEPDGDTGAELLLDWAKANGLIREKIDVAWASIKAKLAPVSDDDDLPLPIYRPTGEIVPGLSYVPGEETFTVTTDDTDVTF